MTASRPDWISAQALWQQTFPPADSLLQEGEPVVIWRRLTIDNCDHGTRDELPLNNMQLIKWGQATFQPPSANIVSSTCAQARASKYTSLSDLNPRAELLLFTSRDNTKKITTCQLILCNYDLSCMQITTDYLANIALALYSITFRRLLDYFWGSKVLRKWQLLVPQLWSFYVLL